MGKASSASTVMKGKKRGRRSKNSPRLSSPSKPTIRYTTRRSRRNPNNCNSEREMEEEDDDERKEKKVKLVERLPQSNHNEEQEKRQNDDCSDSGDSESEDQKGKGKLNDVDCGSDDLVSVQETEVMTETGTSQYGQPLDSGPTTATTTPLPDKKLLMFILDRIQKKDTRRVFSEPVNLDELPDYTELIQQPMDFRTIRKKLDDGAYRYLEQLEADVLLISSNAMQYNAPDTVYYRQARAIGELATRDFGNLKREGDNGEPQPRVVRRGRPPGNRNQRAIETTSLVDRGARELSSGVTTAEGEDKASGSNTYNLRRRNGENYSGSTTNWNDEFPASILRADMKYGKKQFTLDENRRDTYSQFRPLSPANNLSTLSVGDTKQLVPVGLQDPLSYARSLARFAANLGPVAWRVASKKIQTVLPPGVQYGPGWVDETGVTSQGLTLSSQKPKLSNSTSGDSSSYLPVTPLTSGLITTAACGPSERMVEAVRKLNSSSDAYSWKMPFPVQPHPPYPHQTQRNGYGEMYGYDASIVGTGRVAMPGQYNPDGVQVPSQIPELIHSSTKNHVTQDKANLSDRWMTPKPGYPVLQGGEPWNLLESSWQEMPLQQQYGLSIAPELNARIRAMSSSSSSMQIGSPLQPDLALQL